MLKTVILDLETAPISDLDAYLPDVSPRKGTKDEAKQAAQMVEKREALVRDAALDPDLSRICCLGYDTGVLTQWTCRDETEERDALVAFWSLVREAHSDVRIVGYNLLSFDLPRIYRRSLYLDVPAYAITRDKYRHPNVIDLLDVLSEQGRFSYRSLDYYCRRFGLDVPDDPHSGADIPALVAAEDWAAIAAHNAADLLKTRALAVRLGYVSAHVPALV